MREKLPRKRAGDAVDQFDGLHEAIRWDAQPIVAAAGRQYANVG
jgi:hypothetical protein